MSRYDKVDSAYKFLKGKEVSQDSFSLDELAKATGWETGTCKTYVSKRWFQYVHKDQKDFKVSGVAYLSKKEFRAIHSQKLTQLEDQSEPPLVHYTLSSRLFKNFSCYPAES